ncbi:peptidoglycan DD-metalloendopeptidase family protein [Streptomyces sp. NPDC047061]|uniref:M23 family metallopeptidase n=1 Tax=Streptomyces sp. NPDC047061 TaxID=3154605 RepID=UPI00340727CC
MRTDDLRLLVAALVLLLTGAFLTTPAKAAQRPGHCAFGRPSTPPPAAARKGGTGRADVVSHTGRTARTSRTARWTAPTVRYRLSARYAAKGHHWQHRHTGQDFAVRTGTPVYAVGSGRVVAASCGDGFGNQVVLHHCDGYYTQYAHLSVINVRPGQRVSTGQRIGGAGATGNADGPHLHFEVRTTRHADSAIAPLPWLRHHGVSVPATASPEHPRPHSHSHSHSHSHPRPHPRPHPTPSTPSIPDTPYPSALPSAGWTGPAQPWHGRPPRAPGKPGTPTPQKAPATPWNPATPWDLTTLWNPGTR